MTDTQVKQKIYIAGPMRGYPQFNFPKFYEAEEFFVEAGYDVCNPARKDDDTYGKEFSASFPTGDIEAATEAGFSLRDALAFDTQWICKHANAIFMLKGWENSAGACAEHALAKALGLEIMYEWVAVGETVPFSSSPEEE